VQPAIRVSFGIEPEKTTCCFQLSRHGVIFFIRAVTPVNFVRLSQFGYLIDPVSQCLVGGHNKFLGQVGASSSLMRSFVKVCFPQVQYNEPHH
jgi:hypothetical protein